MQRNKCSAREGTISLGGSRRWGPLPTAWWLAQDGHPAVLDLDVAAARQVTQHPADHLPRGTDALTDLRMSQAFGEAPAVGFLGPREQQLHHASVHVLH